MATMNIFATNDVLREYEKTQDNFFLNTQKKKPAKYNSLMKLLERSPLMGAMKYGDNFIA
jgi:hypothetical protein